MTIDPFVLLTPILLLAVIALVRFVGCELVFPLEPPSGPTISKIEPNTLTVCGGFTVFGDRFVSESSVQWDLAPLLTTHFVSATELNVDVDIALGDTLASPATVTVINPENKTSSPFTYNVSLIPGAPHVVTFDDASALQQVGVDKSINSDQPIAGTGIYKGIQLGPGEWVWQDGTPTRAFRIAFSSARSTGSFSFQNNGKRILTGLTVLNFGPADTIQLLDETGNTFSQAIGAVQRKHFDIPWTKCSNTVTIQCPIAKNNLGIVEITYLGPPA